MIILFLNEWKRTLFSSVVSANTSANNYWPEAVGTAEPYFFSCTTYCMSWKLHTLSKTERNIKHHIHSLLFTQASFSWLSKRKLKIKIISIVFIQLFLLFVRIDFCILLDFFQLLFFYRPSLSKNKLEQH